MYHVDKYGIGKVVEMALDKINPNRDRPVPIPSISNPDSDPLVIRCRCPRSHICAIYWHAGTRWLNVP
jgi:hypothetical protein